MKVQFKHIVLGCIIAGIMLSGCQQKETTATLYNKAMAGDAKAQYKIGSCFVYGKCGLPKDYGKGRNWLSKASNRGNADAQYLLYKLYSLKIKTGELQIAETDKGCSALRKFDPENKCEYKGLDKVYDISKARYWLVPAAKQGHIKALTMASWEVLFNDKANKEISPLGSRQDALKNLEKTAAKDEANAQCLLFHIYEGADLAFWPDFNRLKLYDKKKAAQWLYEFAKNPRKTEVEEFLLPSYGLPGENSHYGCISDGIRFAANNNLEKNGGLTRNQSERIYKELLNAFAEESEHVKDKQRAAEDAVFLAKLYYEGKQVPKDYRNALALFNKAYEWGNKSEAPSYISEMYSEGQGIKADPAKAKEWANKVSDPFALEDEKSINAMIDKEFEESARREAYLKGQ